MRDKIAVYCRTEELFRRVDKVMAKNTGNEPLRITRAGTCISSGDNIYAYDSIAYHRGAGYRIISASTYLRRMEGKSQYYLNTYHPAHKPRYTLSPNHYRKCADRFPKPLTLKEGGSNMKKCIEEAYPNSTKDANLVEKHSLALGIHGTFLDGLIVVDNAIVILDEAKRLEAEEQKEKHCEE